jgi:hypothetical protein
MHFDINVSWLMDMIEKYYYGGEIKELVEIVRALDILGANMNVCCI